MEQASDHTQMSIEDVLPAECLADIFNFLTLRELLGIERVCKRWRQVSQRCWSSRECLDFTELSFLKQGTYSFLPLARSNVTHLISKCGNQLNELIAVLDADDEITTTEMLQLIGDHCVNLSHLDLTLTWDEFEIIPESFLLILSKLQSLIISGNIKTVHLETFLQTAQNLEEFVMNDDSDCREEFFRNLTPNCQKLEIYNTNDQSETEYDLSEVLPNLSKLEVFKSNCAGESSLLLIPESCKFLELINSDRNGDLNLNEVLRGLKNLRVLKLTTCDGGIFHPSALAPASQTLEKLHLSNYPYVEEGMWPLFPKMRALVYLGFDSRDNINNDEAITRLIPRCPNLEKLYIYVTNLSTDFIRKVTCMKKIKRLKLDSCGNMDQCCLEYFVDNACETLESFDCQRTRFNDGQLLRVLKRCPKLTELVADIRDKEKFAFEVSMILRDRPKKTPLRLLKY